MTQLTLRGFDQDLERILRKVARDEGVSLNQAALALLRKGAGLAAAVHAPIGHALDPFVGAVAAEDARAVEQSVRQQDLADLAHQRREARRK